VWDELTVSIANESDLEFAVSLFEATARRVLGEDMVVAADRYQQLLKAERLDFGVDEVPRVYVSAAESWTDCTIRYLVPVRSRRRWSSALLMEITRELATPEHQRRVIPAYPRREIAVRLDGQTPQRPDRSGRDEG
jgi:hypothetical protein